jgi:hypothetical protein
VATASQTVSDIAPPFITISPIGVGTDGATTYVEEVRISVEAFQVEHITGYTTYSAGGGLVSSALFETVQTSLLTIPTTTYYGESISNIQYYVLQMFASRYSPNFSIFSATIIEDASHALYSLVPTPTGTDGNKAHVHNCVFDGKGGGSCMDEFWLVGGTSSASGTYTTSFTGSLVPWYTVTSSPKSTSSSSKSDGISMMEQMVGWRMVVLGLAAGIFLGYERLV